MGLSEFSTAVVVMLLLSAILIVMFKFYNYSAHAGRGLSLIFAYSNKLSKYLKSIFCGQQNAYTECSEPTDHFY